MRAYLDMGATARPTSARRAGPNRAGRAGAAVPTAIQTARQAAAPNVITCARAWGSDLRPFTCREKIGVSGAHARTGAETGCALAE